MVVFALIGVAVNGCAAYHLSGGKSMNEKVISLHILESVLGWVAEAVAIILLFTDLYFLDPALSLAITAYILLGVINGLGKLFYLFTRSAYRCRSTGDRVKAPFNR